MVSPTPVDGSCVITLHSVIVWSIGPSPYYNYMLYTVVVTKVQIVKYEITS